MASYVAVKIYGPGHVVAYNYVANFHDGIDVETYGNPDGSSAVDGPQYPPKEFWDRRPVAIDFYNNYMTNFHDNAFEIDGSLHNIRVMRNMMVNSASHPMCNQPAGGGPIYWIRNIAYHAPGGSTRHDERRGGRAVLQQHDSHRDRRRLVGQRALAEQPVSRRELRAGDLQRDDEHELQFVGLQRLPPESERQRVVSVEFTTGDGGRRLRHSGARRGTGGRRRMAMAAAAARATDALTARSFKTLQEYSAATHQDEHSLTLDYDVFVNVPRLDAKDLKSVQKLFKAEDLDFRLKPGSAAIDRGVVLPNITDGFAGAAPDLGALEAGQPAPHYGPR